MIKRVLCLVLALLLTVQLAPAVSADLLTAAPDDRTLKPVFITVWHDEYKNYLVYEYGDDLLMSVSALAGLSLYNVEITDKEIIFQRGAKTVHIHINDSVLTVMDREQGILLNSPVMNIDGGYYLSLSSMIPWLNLRCTMQDGGTMILVPQLISYWDDCETFDLEDHQISLSECAELLGMEDKDAKALAYSEKSFTGKVVDFFDCQETSSWDTYQYYELFDDFFRDQSASENAANLLEDQISILGDFCENSEQFIAAGFPGLENATNAFGTVMKVGEVAAKYYNFCVLFDEDNSAKLKIMESLIDNTTYKGNEELRSAASQVKRAYEDFWDGTLYNLGHQMENLAYSTVEEFTTLDLLKQFKINYLNELPDNKLMKRYAMYEKLAELGMSVWEDGCGEAQQETLEDLAAHAMLNLYATEQCYRAMAQHAIDVKNDYSYDALTAFRKKADDAQKHYAKYLTILVNAEYDALDYDEKSDYANRIQGNLVRLKRTVPPTSIAATAEQAIYLNALQNMGISQLQWDCLDLDGDGDGELVAVGAFNRGYEWDLSTVVLDGYTVGTHTGVYEDYLVSAKGQYPYLMDYYVEIDSGSWFAQGYMCWTGTGWSTLLETETILDMETWEPAEKNYRTGSLPTDEASYKEAYAQLAPTENRITLSNPNLLDYEVAGSTDQLLSQLDTHFSSRKNTMFSLREDLDGDGKEDRLYGIFSAAELYKDYTGNLSEEMRHHSYADRALSLVAAVAGDEGVRLRTCSVYLPYSIATTTTPTVTLDGRRLCVAGQNYLYQEIGEPYTTILSQEDPVAKVFLGKDFDYAQTQMEDFKQWSYWDSDTAEGTYQKIPLTLTDASQHWENMFGDSTAVIDVSVSNYHDSACNSIFGLWEGMPSFDFSVTMNYYAPASTHSPMTQVTDVDGETRLWYSDCYYYVESSDRYYRIEAYFADEENRPLVFADAILLDDLTQSDIEYIRQLIEAEITA